MEDSVSEAILGYSVGGALNVPHGRRARLGKVPILIREQEFVF